MVKSKQHRRAEVILKTVELQHRSDSRLSRLNHILALALTYVSGSSF
jgi:hypothetical protein